MGRTGKIRDPSPGDRVHDVSDVDLPFPVAVYDAVIADMDGHTPDEDLEWLDVPVPDPRTVPRGGYPSSSKPNSQLKAPPASISKPKSS